MRLPTKQLIAAAGPLIRTPPCWPTRESLQDPWSTQTQRSAVGDESHDDRESSGPWSPSKKDLAFALALLLYVTWFIHLSLLLYDSYQSPPFDLAIFDQGMWLTTHLHNPFITINGRNLFGDHASYILLLIAPLYRLLPEPQGLLIIQTLVFASGSIPIYVLLKRRASDSIVATAVAVSFLLNPILQNGNIDQFHPEAFLAPLVSLAIYAIFEENTTLFVSTVILILLVKEDTSLITIPLSIWFAMRRDRRIGLLAATGSTIYAMLTNWLLMPLVLGTTSFYTRRIPFGGVSGLIAVTVGKPLLLIHYLLSQNRPYFLWQLGSTVAFLFLAAPGAILVAMPLAAEDIISNLGTMHTIHCQYTIAFVPILLMSVAYVVLRSSSKREKRLVACTVLFGALTTSFFWGHLPFSLNRATAVPSTTVAAMSYVARGLPANAGVAAFGPFVPHLDHRSQIYVWPNPFLAQNWGVRPTPVPLPDSYELHFVRKIDYLLLPVNPGYLGRLTFVNRVLSHFSLIRSRGGFGLYRRNP